MSARPRPRPRPKPKTTLETSTSSTSLDSARAKSPGQPNNDDDLFIRHDSNRLKAIHSQSKPRERSPVQDVKYFEHENTEESPESKRRRKEMAPKRSKPLPAWTYQPRNVSATQMESDDDSSEPEILDDDAFKNIPSQPLPQPKLRERSITPPPQHLKYQVGNQVQEVLRNLYDADEDRELSPEMESHDAIQLLPELAAIQKNVRASSAVPEPIESRSVELHVKWVPHPVHPQPYESALASWTFNVPLNKPFGEVRRMLTGVPTFVKPVLRGKSRRLYDGGTPASLFAGSRLEIQAMAPATNEYFEERHLNPSSAPASDATNEEDEDPSGSREGSPAAAEKITLRLRIGPNDNRPQTVRVSPDATVETVIAAFLNKTGRAGMQGVRLQIDGDDLEMDSTIADADLEDGDLVEVAGIE